MFIKTITVRQTIQPKQFCPLSVEVTAELTEQDNPDECAKHLRQKANFWINQKIEEEQLDNPF